MVSRWAPIEWPSVFGRSRVRPTGAAELRSRRCPVSARSAGVVCAMLPLLAYLYCKEALEQGISLSNLQGGDVR